MNAFPQPDLEEIIDDKYLPLSVETGKKFADAHEQISVLPGFLLHKGIQLFREEALRLLAAFGKRRVTELSGTPRKFTSVNGEYLGTHGNLIPKLLLSEGVRDFVRGLTGDPLEHYGDVREAMVLLMLAEQGDRHGAHLDEFRGPLNICLEAPSETDTGGILKFVPGNRDFLKIEGPICRSVRLRPGDAYFMDHTNETAHEVTPLSEEGSQRIVAGIAFSNPTEVYIPSHSSHVLFHD